MRDSLRAVGKAFGLWSLNAGGFVTGNVYNDPFNGKTFYMSGHMSSLMVSSAVVLDT